MIPTPAGLQGVYPETLPNGTQLLLAYIQGGSFRMGSKKNDEEAYNWEKPEHEVLVSEFYMAIYPVTQALWRSVVEWAKTTDPEVALDPAPSFFTGDERPVEQVSWEEARLFIEYLNQWTADTPMRQSGYSYRLPSEAEWEYAARGGRHPRGYKYAGSELLKEVGWYSDNSHGETKAVGLKAPNELGLYDMSGNVWEWCEDDWHADYKKAPKDSRPWKDTPDRGTNRVVRGGSWSFDPQQCRPAYRSLWVPLTGNTRGFRLVLALQ